MIKVEYVTIVDKNSPDKTDPAIIAQKLEDKINSFYPLIFLSSNFLGTKAIYSSFPPESNTTHSSYYEAYTPDNTLYKFMLFFDER